MYYWLILLYCHDAALTALLRPALLPAGQSQPGSIVCSAGKVSSNVLVVLLACDSVSYNVLAAKSASRRCYPKTTTHSAKRFAPPSRPQQGLALLPLSE
jgi:hypothetical protein